MINMILLSLSFVNTQPATQTAQVRPCVWPNVCTTQPAPEAVAQVKTCVWPNVCKQVAVPATVTEMAPEVAQFTTCVWPRKCAVNS